MTVPGGSEAGLRGPGLRGAGSQEAGVRESGPNRPGVSGSAHSQPGRPGTTRAWVGCYTRGTGGQGERVESIQRTAQGWRAPTPGPSGEPPVVSPSFLVHAPLPGRVFAVSETEVGAVVGYRIDPDGTAVPVDRQPTGGSFPCHLAVDPTGRFLVSVNYGSGSVAVHPVWPDGTLGPMADLVEHRGGGPDPDRQTGPHPHMAVFVAGLLLVPDLGTDRIEAYRLVDGHLDPVSSAALPPGFGPRHLVAVPGGRIVVVGELAAEIAVLTVDTSGAMTVLGVGPATGRAGRCAPSGLGVGGGGRWVVVANRGVETVALFAVPPAGGRLELRDEVPCGGTEPRDLTVDGDRVHVANQNGGGVVTLRVDPDALVLAPDGPGLPLASPTCVLLDRPAAAGH